MSWLKEYMSENRHTIITLAVIVVLDHYIFDGSFRKKLKGIIDKVLDQTTKQLVKK